MRFFNNAENNTDLKRILYAACYSYNGLNHGVMYESAFLFYKIKSFVELLHPLVVGLCYSLVMHLVVAEEL